MRRSIVYPLAAICAVMLPTVVLSSTVSSVESYVELTAPCALPSVASIDPDVASAQEQPVRYRDIVFERVERTNDIVYGSATDIPTGRTVQLTLDLYEPAGDSEQSRPVLLFIHGGGFVAGDKAAGQRWAMEFARRGWVAVSIKYRLAQGDLATVGIPAAVSDARQSVRWLWDTSPQYRLDLGRLVVGGSSAGAITSLFLSYTEMEKQPADALSTVAGVMDLWGGLYGQEGEMTAGEPPLIIVHGTEDEVVPFRLAGDLRDRAVAVGIPYDYRPLQGVGHGSGETAKIARWTADFFYPLLWPDVNLPTDTPRPPETAVPSATQTPTPGQASRTPSSTKSATAATTAAPPTAGSPQYEVHLPYAVVGVPTG